MAVGPIFEPKYGTDSFPTLSVIWTTLILLVLVIGGLVVLVRAIQDGMALQGALLCVFAMSGGLLYYSRYHPFRQLRTPLKLGLALLGFAAIGGLIVVRKVGI